MILTRTPLRISIGGGGTDLPSYYRRNGGTVISAAIDKYVYLAVNATFTQRLPAQVFGARARRTHRRHRSRARSARFSSATGRAGDRDRERRRHPGRAPASARRGRSPSGWCSRSTRIATSSLSPRALAEAACHIEIERLGDPVGKQDQYIAAFGGMTKFEFRARRHGRHRPARRKQRHTGRSRRPPAAVLHRLFAARHQHPRRSEATVGAGRSGDDCQSRLRERPRAPHRIRARVGRHRDVRRAHARALEPQAEREPTGSRATRSTSGTTIARKNSALGGKLVGAGAGGFLLFYAENPRRVRRAMQEAGLPEVRFSFDHDGAVVLARS